MSDLRLVNGDASGMSQKRLEEFYSNSWIPVEKKTYLTSLKDGMGPFLPTEKAEFLLDASSQIATLGLGFNASPLFGTSHHLEAWWNRKDTANMQTLKRSFRDFLLRKAGWCVGNAFFCNSGAEAVEVALGTAFRRRRSESQVKVLAFRDSFHGRFLLSLASTWNPVKREESEWPDFKSVFCDLPEMKMDHAKDPKIPKGWRGLWAESGRKNFDSYAAKKMAEVWKKDELLIAEMEALSKIREELRGGKIFAVLVEPLQCEGGDKYSSSRYQNGLINLCQSFGIPLIYDEVQTGFGLGGEFFWHRIFDLRSESGTPLFPDFVVMAKKAQLGVVLSHEPIDFREQFAAHSMVRGYLQGMALDQSRNETEAIERELRQHNLAFVKKFKKHLEFPRTQGLSFCFDFKDKELLRKFVQARFTQGLMYYPAGSNTARFRLNLAYDKRIIEILFKRLSGALESCLADKAQKSIPPVSFARSPSRLLNLHRDWRRSQWETLGKKVKKVKAGDSRKELKLMKKLFEHSLGEHAKSLTIQLINRRNFSKFARGVQSLQKLVYEPSRRTENLEYEAALSSDAGIGIAILQGKQVVAIGLAGSLEAFPFVRGVKKDWRFGSNSAAYVCDITVSLKVRGLGLGSFLKHALARVLQSRGIVVMQGRNRDQHAAKMVKMNLSMGAMETQYLREDYPDVDAHRDAIYYSIPLQFEAPELQLSLGVDSPWSGIDFSESFKDMAEQYLFNKMCLSNFVSGDFLCGLESFAPLVPRSMRRFYTTSGQSECVDKIVKSIWAKRKVQRVLSFREFFFGHGSMLSRGLSGVRPSYYPTDLLEKPTEENWQVVLNSVRDSLKQQSYLAVFVEPMGQLTMERLPLPFLQQLAKICREFNTPLISNDTGGQFGRYSSESFLPSALFEADGGFVFTGGHMGICYLNPDIFVEKPLAIISTWDGDEYSLQAYTYAVLEYKNKMQEQEKIAEKFQAKLESIISHYDGVKFHGLRGFGWIEGNLPVSLAALFSPRGDGHGLMVCPNLVDMQKFLTRKELNQ